MIFYDLKQKNDKCARLSLCMILRMYCSECSIVPYSFFDRYFSRFPYKFEHGDHTSYAHSTHQYDEHAAHVGKAQLIGRTVGL